MRPLPGIPSLVLLLAVGHSSVSRGQVFVEYPAHPATYGDHAIAATWPGGPAAVSVEFDADSSVRHADGVGQSQRTARNTLTFTPPSAATNPQDYDDPQLVARYGARLPLLQQMAADGVCTLRYVLSPPVSTGFDLWLTDVDSGDSVTVRALAPAGAPIDVGSWIPVSEGDLSLFKNTGTAYSPIRAPLPVASFLGGGRVFRAADTTNYNRSFTILRAPAGEAVASIEVRFRGLQNSASRADAGTGSHVYLGLSTTPALTGAPGRPAAGLQMRVSSPAHAVLSWSLTLPASSVAHLALHDVGGRRVRTLFDGTLPAGTREGQSSIDGLPAGLYWLRLSTEAGQVARGVVVLE